MPRHRSHRITESASQLRRLEKLHGGTPAEIRLRALRAIGEDPSEPFSRIAERIGCSERSLMRWWRAYRTGGVDAVVGRSSGRTARLKEDVLEELKGKVASGELKTLPEIRRWLSREHGVVYSPSGVWRLLRRIVPEWKSVPRPGNDAARTERAAPVEHEPTPIVPPHIVRFLNAMPGLVDDLKSGVIAFREALQELFPEVDKVVVYMDFSFRMEDPANYVPDIYLDHLVNTESEESERADIVEIGNRPDHSSALLNMMRGQGLPVDDYYPPDVIELGYKNYANLGTMFLFRSCCKTPLPEATLKEIRQLQPFFSAVIFGQAAQYQASKPNEFIATFVVRKISSDGDLSLSERKALMCQLMGYSYKETADRLHVSIATIKKHLTSVHRKTGTTSLGELFGKYLSFRPDLKDDLEIR